MPGVGGSLGGGQGGRVKLVESLSASYRRKKTHWNTKEGGEGGQVERILRG